MKDYLASVTLPTPSKLTDSDKLCIETLLDRYRQMLRRIQQQKYIIDFCSQRPKNIVCTCVYMCLHTCTYVQRLEVDKGCLSPITLPSFGGGQDLSLNLELADQGQAGWPASSKDSPVPSVPTLALKVCVLPCPASLFAYWGSNLGPRAYMVSTTD